MELFNFNHRQNLHLAKNLPMEQTGQKKRNQIYDIARGIAIILVVWGHIIPSNGKISNFVYLFHMPFFIVLSGFFYKDKYFETLANSINFIISRFKRLMLPFIGFTFICGLLHNFFINIHFYELSPKIKYFHSVTDMLNFEIFHMEPLIASIWFLLALFFISLLFTLINLILKKFNLNYEIYRLVVVLLFLQLGFYISFQPWCKFLYIGTTCSSLTLFYAGYLFAKIKNVEKLFNIRNFLFSFVIIAILDIVLQNTIYISADQYYNPGLLMLLSIISFVLVCSFASFIKSKKLAKMLSYIGRNTLPILCLHVLSFKIAARLLIFLFGERFVNLAASSNVNAILSLQTFMYLFAGIILPLIINELYLKIKVNARRMFIKLVNF